MAKRTTSRRRLTGSVLGVMVAGGSLAAYAQVKTNVPDVVPGARPAIVEHIKIHGKALEGNLEGNAVDRDVIVVLPPGYNQNRARRYPVVYALHGYSIDAEQWTQEIQVPQTIEGAFARGACRSSAGRCRSSRRSGDEVRAGHAAEGCNAANNPRPAPATASSAVPWLADLA